jgi:hypothetical protein
MIFTVTTFPSVAETHGSQRPNVTASFVSTAPSDPIGISFMGSQCLPLDVAKKDSASMRLHADEAAVLGARTPRLLIAGERL